MNLVSFVYGRSPFPRPMFADYSRPAPSQGSPCIEPLRLPDYRLYGPQAPRTRADRKPDVSRQGKSLRTHRGGRA